MKRKLIVLLVLLLLAVAGYKYLYQDHRDIQKEQPEYVISSNFLANEFSRNSIEAEKKYLNKTIEINGVITEINITDITLNNSVFCQFVNTINNTLKTNDNIIIKGRFIGYDDLLEQVKLDQCNVIQ